MSINNKKAVCILLTLLSLGIKKMYLGPTLPAFLSEGVVKILVEQYDQKLMEIKFYGFFSCIYCVTMI